MPTTTQTQSQMPPDLLGGYDDERHAAEPASLPVHFIWHLAQKRKPTATDLEETAKECVESSGFTNVVATHCKDSTCKERGMHAHVVGQMPRELALHYMDRCLGA